MANNHVTRIPRTTYPLDSSGLIHLAALRPHHSNTYRIGYELNAPVDPAALQAAFDLVAPRFPSIVAGIRAEAREFRVVPADAPPRVEPDRGFHCFTAEEIEKCALAVRYRDAWMYLDIFHSLTDGYGAFTFLTTLTAVYLDIKGIAPAPYGPRVLNPQEKPGDNELVDDYLAHAGGKSAPADRAVVYQLPGEPLPSHSIIVDMFSHPASSLRNAAREHGVSVTAFATAVMLEAVARVQQHHNPQGEITEPMQVAVPADVRNAFASTSLRNFSLLVYPRMEAAQAALSFRERLALVNEQLKSGFSLENMRALITTYTNAQHNPLVRILPLGLKVRIARIVHHVFGARNSCITLSNLGMLDLPEAMAPHVRNACVLLTPRIQSPYNFGMITCGGSCTMSFTRFCEENELVECFKTCLEERMREAHVSK